MPILAKYFEHITRHIVLEQEKLERSSLENLGTHVVDGTFDFVLLQMCRACSLCMQTRLQCMHPLGCLQRKAAKNKFTQGRLTPERTRDVATPLSRSKSLARRFDFARHSPPTCHVSDFEDYMTCLDSVGGVCHPPRLVSASTTALVLNFAGELLGSHGRPLSWAEEDGVFRAWICSRPGVSIVRKQTPPMWSMAAVNSTAAELVHPSLIRVHMPSGKQLVLEFRYLSTSKSCHPESKRQYLSLV